MTKLRSKKMTKSTFAVIIMAIAMVAMLAFGGTYAFFTAQTTEVSKTATTGRIQLGANGLATLVQTVVPGQELLTAPVTVESKSNVKSFVFITFSVDFAKASGEGINAAAATKSSDGTCDTEGEYKLTYEMSEKDGEWALVDGQTDVYFMVVTGSEEAKAIEVCSSIKFDGHSVSTETLKGSLMDGTVTVTIDSSAAQYDGFEYEAEATEAEKAAVAYAKATIA